MDLSLWCILVAAFLPLIAIAPAKRSPEFDNSRPRDPAYWTDEFRSRAAGAMANSYEAFPFFLAVVLISRSEGGSHAMISWLALAYIVSRIAYILAYWGNRATIRSALWSLGVLINLAIFLTPFWAPAAAL